MPKVNQELIAQRLNLSRATVSRSLANHPAISVETRRLVQEMAAKLGYKLSPGRAARRGKKSRTFTIGVVIGVPRGENVTMVTYPHILKGIRDRAEIERVTVDVSYQIRNNDWRGAILVHPFPEPAVALIASRISTVSVLESYNEPGIDIIDTDDAPAILDLVLKLSAAGHKRIGFVSWTYPVGGHWVARRFSGYVEALFYQGLEFRPEWVLNVHKNSPRLQPQEVSATVAKLFKQDHVTAWVCAADHQAYPLMQDLAARGIRVPEDCSVTGFDGLEPPAGLRRATSMRIPHEHIGSSAMTRLVNRMAHPAAPRRKILVEGELVEGETIAAPRPL
jgi:LacI family transcriptional regulator